MFQKKLNLAVRFDLNPPTIQRVQHQLTDTKENVDFEMISLPLYLVGQMVRLVKGRLDGNGA